jgi:peptidoglycan/LPS O-acetylase OafA/YrhL
MTTIEASRMRIPSLDGLRALSISFVLFAHLSGTTGFPRLPKALTGGAAVFGVRVFFVISGFLITSLLLAEIARTGTVSVRHFYLRRTLRIFPPFYVYIAAIALAGALGWVALGDHDILAALTYTTNYHHERSWYLGHTWSLAVEEQFYLLWPFLVKYLGVGRATRLALVTIIAAPLLRIGLLVGAPAFRPGIGETFPTVADAIATGCLLACVRGRIDSSPRVLAFLRGPAFWLIPAGAMAFAFVPSAKADALFGQTITNLGIALAIERFVRFPVTPFGRLLNARPIVFVGVLSYSLYLWQQPFLNRHAHLGLTAFPMNLALAFAAALASYYLIERPALRLRARIEAGLRGQRAAAVAAPPDPPAGGPGVGYGT